MSNHWLDGIAVILFDLDGTLYEETSQFDHYARLLAEAVPPEHREAYMADYQAILDGRHPLRVGLLYDADRDLILKTRRGLPERAWDWSGKPLSPPEVRRLYPEPVTFDHNLHIINLGDLWGVPAAAARHHGMRADQTFPCFLQVRQYMMTDAYRLTPVAGLAEALAALRPRYRLVMATNSPEEDSLAILGRLGLQQSFDRTYFLSDKPRGIPNLLARIEQDFGAPPRAVLSVGDNLVNEILPCRLLGCRTAFLDPHHTREGEAPDWDVAVDGIRDLLPLLLGDKDRRL